MMIKYLENASLSNRWIAAIAIAVIAAMILILVIRSKSKKKQQSIIDAYIKKSREEELDRILRNEDKEHVIMESRPYEVSYEDSGSLKNTGSMKNHKTSIIRVRVTVRAEYSTKKYLLEVAEQVSIGRNKTNEIVLDDKNVSGTHCALLNEDGLLYVRDRNSRNGTTLIRKYRKTKVGNNPIRIKEGDKLQIAENTIIINFV